MTITLTDKEVWLVNLLVVQEYWKMKAAGEEAYAASTKALIDKLAATGIPRMMAGTE